MWGKRSPGIGYDVVKIGRLWWSGRKAKISDAGKMHGHPGRCSAANVRETASPLPVGDQASNPL